jgi:glutathione S-transferase
MLKLYHGQNSVCSQKARMALAELDRPYESIIVNLGAGEQFKPDYMKLNPNAVVPTIDDEGKIVIESSVIMDYLNETTEGRPLMPRDPHGAALVRTWLLRCLENDAAANSLTFGAAYRHRFLHLTPDEREAGYRRIPDPARQAKRWDLVENGIESRFVSDGIRNFRKLFREMDSALSGGDWLVGNHYTLADAALLPYVDRLNRLRLNGFWDTRHPRVAGWYARSRARPSFNRAIDEFVPPEDAELLAKGGAAAWPQIERKLNEM